MRSFFSNEDMATLLTDVFKNNTLDVTLIDEDTQEETQSDMVSYLSVEFYTWWNHAQSAIQDMQYSGQSIRDAWKESLNYSIGKSYALIEQTDEETIASEDIVGASVYGRITFMIDANKISNLEYYLRYLKNEYTGKPVKRETTNGDSVVGYLTLGILLYDQEPQMTQVGEVITASINWKWSYMQLAGTYSDVALQLSLNGVTYYDMTITKYTWQNIFTKESVPTANRPDLTGFLVKSISHTVTLSFYDFDKDLTNVLNGVFWGLNAVEIDNVATTTQNVNIPIYLEATIGEHTYIYKCVLTDMQKVFQNNDFTISSITLNGWGKVGS